MSKLDVIRAWKDKEYRNSLSQDEQALLPENPAGRIELDSTELEEVNGGTTPIISAVTAVTGALTAVSYAVCASYLGGGSCSWAGIGCS